MGVREGMRTDSGSGDEESRGALHDDSDGMGSAVTTAGRLERGKSAGAPLEERLLGEEPGFGRLTC